MLAAAAGCVRTIAEAGVPGYDIGYWFAAYAPARMLQPVVIKLNEILARNGDTIIVFDEQRLIER
jgi:tripartite-type tricarboxylate transporter receptor subunit TctC